MQGLFADVKHCDAVDWFVVPDRVSVIRDGEVVVVNFSEAVSDGSGAARQADQVCSGSSASASWLVCFMDVAVQYHTCRFGLLCSR